jgi:hypothetical protein
VCTIWFHFSSIKYSPHSFYWFFFSFSWYILFFNFIPYYIIAFNFYTWFDPHSFDYYFFFWVTGNFTYWFLRVCLIWSNLVSWSGSWVLKIDSFWLYFFNFILRYRLLSLQFMIFFTFLWGYHNLISQVMG